jgi:lambda family phage tail tape measure protein
MCQQILKQLPMMFLQAGLQLIANGQWPLGLGFIAAAGSTAIISGYVDGASKHAQGGVFDEYGRAARAFAAGGAFTNQIVSAPTYFRYGGGFDLGLMGEAGPEAVVPLTRMGDGSLGVRTENGGGTKVVVNIINNSGGEVKQEEHEDGEGNRQIDVIIGDLVNNHLGSGKADRVLSGRYGLRAAGV